VKEERGDLQPFLNLRHKAREEIEKSVITQKKYGEKAGPGYN
jgi:hypothetical protein